MRRIQARRRILTAYEPPEPRAWREPTRKRNARRLAVRKLKARLDDGRRFLLFCKNRPDWLLWWVEVGMLAATEIMMLAVLCDAFMSIGITRKTLFLFVSAGNLAAASMFWWCFKPDEKPRDCCTRGLLWLMLPVCGLFAVIFFDCLHDIFGGYRHKKTRTTMTIDNTIIATHSIACLKRALLIINS